LKKGFQSIITYHRPHLSELLESKVCWPRAIGLDY
jgi:hypothetical protein